MLFAALSGRWRVRVQSTLAVGHSIPQPDIAVVRLGQRTGRPQYPNASERASVVKVSYSTLDTDRAEKPRIYARGGIPCYWIVNGQDQQIEAFTQPAGDGYAQGQVYRAGERVPVVLNGVTETEIAVAEVLP